MATVRFHILDEHPDKLCYICCGASPVFHSREQLVTHLTKSHDRPRVQGGEEEEGDDVEYLCFDCDPNVVIQGK
jgi:hypothetical protein